MSKDEIKYEMVIYWSEDDDAIKNTLTVIQEWIDTAIELGREIPIPKGRLIYA